MQTNWFKNKGVLIPYFTLGDPDIPQTESLVARSFDRGAGIIELGIPFSDPIADGPVIQASHFRALSGPVRPNIADGFAMVTRLRASYSQPIVFMLSVNLILAYGISRFFKDAQISGISGVVIPDLPVEDAGNYLKYSRKHNVAIIFLVSPLCRDDRLKKIVDATSGFLYLISTTGTTGARTSVASGLADFVAKIKAIRDIPVAVGFGISHPSHFKEVCAYADGGIVGSHFVSLLAQEGTDRVLSEIDLFLNQVV
ncbi:tryptophan synthase subunit alpha [bacterium]|nr:tryptophan synthase subunit alpha [bacterium]